MEFRATLSIERETSRAVDQICREVAGFEADLALVFTSHHHIPEIDGLVSAIGERLNIRNLIGCTAESIIGPDREVERAPALAFWAARLPGVQILPFYLDQSDLERFENLDEWHDRLGVRADDHPSLIVLPDPYSIDVETCLEKLDQAVSSSVIVGGVASGASGPGQNRLFLNDQTLQQGLVGVSLCGPVKISSVVSQGCRPIGTTFVVTKSQDNIIEELGGRPALEVLQEVFRTAEPAEQALIQRGLMVGRVVDEHLREFQPGDFLIRNVMGIVEQRALAVSDAIRPGQTVQFHVRDSKTASDEMNALMSTEVGKLPHPPAGGLLFSCNGRGRRLFGRSNHDIGVVNSNAADCAVAGFFANGEIGPVGQKTFIHSFTSSLILFSEPE